MTTNPDLKRKLVEDQTSNKKQRTNETSLGAEEEHKESTTTTALVHIQPKQQALIATPATSNSNLPPRTSSLLAATMQLKGHAAAIYACQFSRDGKMIASGGSDRTLLLWELINGECQNTQTLSGHTGTILDVSWSGSESVLTASADSTVAVWDVTSGTRLKRIRAHHGIVNSVDVSRRGVAVLATASDDGYARMWDLRSKHWTQEFNEQYPILSVALSDDATQVFTAGISNDIKCYDIRTGKLLFDLLGHRDSVTGLSVSPDGSYLLSNSMDMSLRCWDIRPYSSSPSRQTSLFTGHTHSGEQNLLRCGWSSDGLKVSSGSADGAVNIWDASTTRLAYRLPGHTGSVNDISFHPTESVILSGSNDKTMWLGEL